MPTASSIPVQLQVTTRSTPPIAPVDLNTGDWPAIWKGSTTVFNAAIFDPQGFPVDLSNLSKLTLQIFPYVPPQNYLGYPLPDTFPALITVDVATDDITPVITTANWLASLVQNAAFIVTDAQTLALDLQGQPFNRFIITISGLFKTGINRVIYGSGPIFVYESGITISS
jgi:hypothetical protein